MLSSSLNKPVPGLKMVLSILVVVLVACTPPSVETPKKATQGTFYEAPEWSKDVIWYQIFPDRFRNGDPSNDPDVESLTGTWPYANPEGWQVSPWGSDWYKLQPWEVNTGEDFWFNAQLRRYGGDIQGIIDKLDYLDSLGVTALYLNPIFESASSHKYGCTMWRHVDNNFGPDPAGDEAIWSQENPADPSTWEWTSADLLFLELIQEVHNRDMRIIIDGVFNHTGIPFWGVEDVRKKGPESEFADWFHILSYDDPSTPEDEFDYRGWYGVKDLPELKEDENGPIPAVREHLHAIVKRWMDPNGDGDPSDGIDGWRLDVAEMVSQNFWRDFRVWTREINPESYLVGEVWWEDFGNNLMFEASEWLQGDIFDAVMNYRFGDAMLRSFVDQQWQVKPSQLDSLLAVVRDHYPLNNQYVLMNMFNSHDTERLSSMVNNPDRTIDHGGNSRDYPNFNFGPPNAEQRAIQRTMLLFQFTYPGAPLVYYGEEKGMWGADDPGCRKPMLWPDIEYEDEVTHPHGRDFGPFEVEPDEALFQYYHGLIKMRNASPTLRTGDYKTILVDDENGYFAFRRDSDTDSYIALFNLGTSNWTPGEKLFGASGSKDWTLLVDSNGLTNESIPPRAGKVYQRNN